MLQIIYYCILIFTTFLPSQLSSYCLLYNFLLPMPVSAQMWHLQLCSYLAKSDEVPWTYSTQYLWWISSLRWYTFIRCLLRIRNRIGYSLKWTSSDNYYYHWQSKTQNRQKCSSKLESQEAFCSDAFFSWIHCDDGYSFQMRHIVHKHEKTVSLGKSCNFIFDTCSSKKDSSVNNV